MADKDAVGGAARIFRTERSVAAELATRSRVEPLLERHGFTITGRGGRQSGTAITQVIDATRDGGPQMRMHVRLCWRRDGRNASENLYSAAQLRARLDDGGWEQTLANVAARHERDGYTHLLLVQDSPDGFALAAAIPSADIPAIWLRQRDVSADLIARGRTGRQTKNHAMNGASPTIYLQDDRQPDTAAVARVVWDWPGVLNVLALPTRGPIEPDLDTLDDIRATDQPGRDGADRLVQTRSGYPRDPAVRAAVRERADGRCEREGCGEHRAYAGFLDVHHILGIEVSDRTWTCVALCPNCHREAHFSPERDVINTALGAFAARFRP